ncbi:MAG: YidC/Oxa1 family insertase periplasmic-domain containing protein [Gemmatimonadetes bacterium]|nr:YidC/Oxa1 family insertase periplasmic-domain containing protein [Gemmatimonadota bacterium]MDA1102134.1 YidC/Oxa1 family insertase periplasmic-domain containing protein [Gemmatimonadota bacterium]
MKTEARFLLAAFLMLAILIGTNRLFPPIVPEAPLVGDSLGSVDPTTPAAGGPEAAQPSGRDTPTIPGAVSRNGGGDAPRGTEPAGGGVAVPPPPVEGAPEVVVAVTSPMYRYEFSTVGAQMLVAELSRFEALNRPGLVDLIPEGAGGYLGHRLIVASDTIDLSEIVFNVEPAAGLELLEGGAPESLRFFYEHPTSDFGVEIEYTFDPADYTVGVRGGVRGVERALLVTDLGEGLAYTEADSALEARMMAQVHNHLGEGVRSVILSKAEPTVVEGPLLWAAFRNKFFVLALLAGEADETTAEAHYLGGLIVRDGLLPERVRVGAAQSLGSEGTFAYRVFIGPQEYALLSSLGQGMEEVNPYGWRIFRPIIRPIVSIIMTVLVFLHTQLSLGYGWVLIVFGFAMRIVLFPLNHKAMKAQLKNMSVQPLVKEAQDKYKDNPEKLQKEMMKLYKEHGFNPLAGCLPMLLPWPVLIALFFVFQNTIELRGVEFLWLPDLSAKDPLYVLPILLALSMFVMQWVSLRSLEQDNPQMKMMMYIMPPMMLFIFMNLASGLNLYYVATNIATIPQQVWIARERQKMQGRPPLTISARE